MAVVKDGAAAIGLPSPDVKKVSIEQRARAALAKSPIYALQCLEVQRSGERLLIRGSVSSYYHKQLAQEVIRSVVGEIEVINSLQVD